jgi:predicted RNA binding protein YcfA (HicA-like mRNA interferase family)
MGQYPPYNCRQLERRFRAIGCELVRKAGSHRHYSNPFRPDRLIPFAWHPGDMPRHILDHAGPKAIMSGCGTNGNCLH